MRRIVRASAWQSAYGNDATQQSYAIYAVEKSDSSSGEGGGEALMYFVRAANMF